MDHQWCVNYKKIVTNRFSVKPQDSAVNELAKKYPFPENCKVLEPPFLNEQVSDKINANARKADTWLSNVQLCVGKAAAAAVSASGKMHTFATEMAGMPYAMEIVKTVNETLSQVGDVIALLGNAHQELSVRRRFQLQSALPKDMQSICAAKIKPGQSKKLFGEDTDCEKLMKSAKEASRAKNSQYRYHPYRREGTGFSGSYRKEGQRGSSVFLGRGGGRSFRRPYHRGAGRGFRK